MRTEYTYSELEQHVNSAHGTRGISERVQRLSERASLCSTQITLQLLDICHCRRSRTGATEHLQPAEDTRYLLEIVVNRERVGTERVQEVFDARLHADAQLAKSLLTTGVASASQDPDFRLRNLRAVGMATGVPPKRVIISALNNKSVRRETQVGHLSTAVAARHATCGTRPRASRSTEQTAAPVPGNLLS